MYVIDTIWHPRVQKKNQNDSHCGFVSAPDRDEEVKLSHGYLSQTLDDVVSVNMDRPDISHEHTSEGIEKQSGSVKHDIAEREPQPPGDAFKAELPVEDLMTSSVAPLAHCAIRRPSMQLVLDESDESFSGTDDNSNHSEEEESQPDMSTDEVKIKDNRFATSIHGMPYHVTMSQPSALLLNRGLLIGGSLLPSPQPSPQPFPQPSRQATPHKEAQPHQN